MPWIANLPGVRLSADKLDQAGTVMLAQIGGIRAAIVNHCSRVELVTIHSAA